MIDLDHNPAIRSNVCLAVPNRFQQPPIRQVTSRGDPGDRFRFRIKVVFSKLLQIVSRESSSRRSSAYKEDNTSDCAK
jgi:hypothetical protein